MAGDPVMDDPDPLGGDAELGHDLVGHELGRGVDPGPFGDGPADDVGIDPGRGVAEGGEADGGEVVDGDDPGRPPGRGDDEIRPVDDLDGAGEPFDGGNREVGPDPVEGTGRHRTVDHPDRRGEERGEEVTTSPGDGEGGHIEVRS
jgi:hypothetical protein